MSKQITSPVARWAGTVTIADPLTLIQAQAIESGLEYMLPPEFKELGLIAADAIKRFGEDSKEAEAAKKALEDYRYFNSITDIEKAPAILACVEKWELKNFVLASDGSMPATPRKDSHLLIEWLFDELRKVYKGEEIVPNE
jgi:hypothetical protein